MNNLDNCVEKDKINSQLEKAEIQKSRLIRNIYIEYELYLNLVRDLLYNSAKKGLNYLYLYSSIQDNSLNANEYFSLFEKKISKLIYSKLPFLTVEQLKINQKKETAKNSEFKSLEGHHRIKDYQKDKFQYGEFFQLEEPIHFQISENFSNNFEYYNVEKHEEFVSLDFDKNDPFNYFSNNNIDENTGAEKQLIHSLLELVGEVKLEKERYSWYNNINQMDIHSKHHSFKNFELIDNSLEKLLLNLSYKINVELFRANLIKKMISQDSFEYLVGKKLMIKNPYPFVIDFEFNINHLLSNEVNLPNIVFVNISTVELEYKNLNLSIQRNKIIELKSQFQHLIKKERYWKQKEITLNKIR